MGCDRISELPEVLLTQILSYLPTKDSVRTSVLSKTWKFTWLRVPVLDLMVSNFPNYAKDFVSSIDNFLEYNKKSRMQKFKIYYDNYYGKRPMEWIGTTIDLGIQHLVVQNYINPSMRYFMPLNIYKSNTLVSLKLVTFGIHNPELVSLPCLKILHLEYIWYDFDFYHFGFDPLIMEKLISGCPVLEDLTLIKPLDYYNLDFLPFLRVRSQTLKIFRLTFDNYVNGTNWSVEIDAPRLEYLSFRDEQSDMIVVKNLSSLFMIDIDTEFNVEFGGSPLGPDNDLSKRDTIRECKTYDHLSAYSRCKYILFDAYIARNVLLILYDGSFSFFLQALYRYPKLGPIPKFNNLFRLEAEFSRSMLQLLPVFLESCPNLKDLILESFVKSSFIDSVYRRSM